ncbi:heme-binding protein [Mycobacterium sp. ITM-2016-00317]|uniref:heme-binding protein n=1 Tax=Mycobacterium sp. ITM-2016-00317 TaxID=2099694 RepID=UPI000D400DDF|nr:heme-binding protein [Mycobacterium sp. ITM-2016-00317]WNG86636.1 heme-binding protein [Mycobacterium sp. ITM-2016-00317]
MSVLVRSAGAAMLVGAALLGSGAVATAQPTPTPAPAPPQNCSVADQSIVLSGVSASLADYMFSHPDVNGFFTSLRGLPPDERRDRVTDYMEKNPQVANELQGVRQPMTDFRARCGLPPASMPDE